MRIAKFNDLGGTWSPDRIGEKPIPELPISSNASTPLVNIMRKYNFDFSIGAMTTTRFGKKGEALKCGQFDDSCQIVYGCRMSYEQSMEEIIDYYGGDPSEHPDDFIIDIEVSFHVFSNHILRGNDFSKEYCLEYVKNELKLFEKGKLMNLDYDHVDYETGIVHYMNDKRCFVRKNEQVDKYFNAYERLRCSEKSYSRFLKADDDHCNGNGRKFLNELLSK